MFFYIVCKKVWFFIVNFVPSISDDNMKIRILLIIISICMPAFALAENKPKATLAKDSVAVPTVLSLYADSLSIYKSRVDSLERIISQRGVEDDAVQELDPRYVRLFVPLTFYHDLAHRHFSLDSDDEALTHEQLGVDNALMNIYLYHPKHVKRLAKGELVQQADTKTEEKKVDPTPVPKFIDTPKADEQMFEPVDLVIKRPNFWTFSGNFSFQMMQNRTSKNWHQGFVENYSWVARPTFRANYNNKQKVTFNNTLEMRLGFQTNTNDDKHPVKATENFVRYTGNLGLQAFKKWYYTIQYVGTTQLVRNFAHNSDRVTADFLSPYTGNLSIGMDYKINWFKGKMNGNIHIAPVSINHRYVDRLPLSTSHGVEEGKHSKTDIGGMTIDMRINNFKISKNITWSTYLRFFSPYDRTEALWENTVNVQISKLLSMTLIYHVRFDDAKGRKKDKDLGYFQMKEGTTFGLNYNF